MFHTNVRGLNCWLRLLAHANPQLGLLCLLSSQHTVLTVYLKETKVLLMSIKIPRLQKNPKKLLFFCIIFLRLRVNLKSDR